MGKMLFSHHADQALRGQWRLNDLPWDEPVRLGGASRRERLLCKLDLLDICEAMYHFKLGARARMGELHVRAWSEENQLSECLEWLDADELRHLTALRKLHAALRQAEKESPDGQRRPAPSRMWKAHKCPRQRKLGAPTLALRTLVDEAITKTLFRSVARGNHVPLVRAVFGSCERDDERHVAMLTDMLVPWVADMNPVLVVALQGEVIAHVARLQAAFRPYFRPFASVTGSTTESIASELFRSVSQAVTGLGPAWVRYPTARIVHTADRSPWMLWLLR